MEVTLLDHTKLSNAVIAGRTAYQSFHKGGNYAVATDKITKVDEEFINRLVHKFKHKSIIEQVVYNFKMDNFSRALLQQWSRSRIMSQTVMSTRYVKPKDFTLHKTGNEELDIHIQNYFDETIEKFGNLSNDILKYSYPEALNTKNVVQINARELLHLCELRLDKAAMDEYRELMILILDSLPEEHKFLYSEFYGSSNPINT